MSFAIVATLYRSLTIYLFRINLLKNIPSNTSRAFAVKNDIASNLKLLKLYISKVVHCTRAHLPILFHLATAVFHLVST